MYGTKSKAYVVILSFSGLDWSYLTAETVYFLIDGERKSFELQRLNTEVNTEANVRSVLEQYLIQLTPKDFEWLTNSEEISFKVGDDIYKFNEKAMNAIRLLKNKVNEVEFGK